MKPLLEDCRFDDLFESLKFCPQVITKNRGSYCIKPEGYLFIALGRGTTFRYEKRLVGHVWQPTHWVLHAKPKDGLLDTIRPRCCDGDVASFELIEWKDTGKALVIAHDTVHIGRPWVAFIAADSIPDVSNLPLE